MISASAGSFDLVKFFLEHGSNPNSANQNKQRPLHYAASKNFPKFEKKLSHIPKILRRIPFRIWKRPLQFIGEVFYHAFAPTVLLLPLNDEPPYFPIKADLLKVDGLQRPVLGCPYEVLDFFNEGKKWSAVGGLVQFCHSGVFLWKRIEILVA